MVGDEKKRSVGAKSQSNYLIRTNKKLQPFLPEILIFYLQFRNDLKLPHSYLNTMPGACFYPIHFGLILKWAALCESFGWNYFPVLITNFTF